MADIIRFLNSGPEAIVGVARESGIGMYKLNKWKDGNGEPCGDDMLKLVDAVSVINGHQKEPGKEPVPPGKYWAEIIRKLEIENDHLRQTVHDLKGELKMLSSGQNRIIEPWEGSGND
jgi:hypothetical protein